MRPYLSWMGVPTSQVRRADATGCYGDTGYVHDTQCVIYEGPDARYEGDEICFNSNAPGEFMGSDHWVEVVDVTDKENPVSLSPETYPDAGYSHQGWLTPTNGGSSRVNKPRGNYS